jgi:hypothetical protein
MTIGDFIHYRFLKNGFRVELKTKKTLETYTARPTTKNVNAYYLIHPRFLGAEVKRWYVTEFIRERPGSRGWVAQPAVRIEDFKLTPPACSAQ